MNKYKEFLIVSKSLTDQVEDPVVRGLLKKIAELMKVSLKSVNEIERDELLSQFLLDMKQMIQEESN